MKKSVMILAAVIGALVMSGNVAKADGGTNMAPNGNYKHNIPVSQGHVFKNNFTKPEKESFNRNYKQQNQAVGTVKFKEHFTKSEKINRSNSKHPYGL